MERLDKTYSITYHFKTQPREIENYKGLSRERIAEIFNYLNSVAYNYPIGYPPKMDKTIFHSR